MKYSVILTARAKKQLAKLDKPVAKLYRVGDYRLIADIQDDKVIIMIVEIGHRSTVYD